MESIIRILADELNKSEEHIKNVIYLIDEGSTIPFIARYRKEMHGTMDDSVIRDLADRLNYLRNLSARREEVKKAIAAQDKLTEALTTEIDNAKTLAEVEDIYRPYKQKRRTRASIAKEKGLEPLALTLMGQSAEFPDIWEIVSDYINTEKDVNNAQEALEGASDIAAEIVADSAEARRRLREFIFSKGYLTVAAEKDEDCVYSLYYKFEKPLSRLQGHQILAINRGEKEGFLKVSVQIEREQSLRLIWGMFVKPGSCASDFVRSAVEDGYDRLLFPSIEREVRSTLTDTASEGAIHNFSINLKPLLMQPPIKGHVTMGLDPGYRNGCKVAVVDGTGKILDTAVVYPTFGERQKTEAIAELKKLINKHKVAHIAIGNGTASRETEQMTCELIADMQGVTYMIVNEAGASVYSASKLAAEEFPQYDVNLRSAISIARRMQDPLAELVKIDPKAIGVGQYQHDMPQKRLNDALCGVVEDCVNAVGVDLNTASPSLLQRVSGLNGSTAKNIVLYREENGTFTSRKQLLKVPKLGPKAYEQCAGFLRVPESKSVMDNTGVHPESYSAAQKLIALCGYTLRDVADGKISDLQERVEKYGVAKAASECAVGVPTLRDIVKELIKPGRDPRDELPAAMLRTDVMDISDLAPNMILSGTVRNVIDFGVFVDIGVHQDGLVHISELADKFIRHPSEMVSVGERVEVMVLSVDTQKKRISLSMKKVNQ
ncbi:MAG: Tex family protein [Eubacteriaceae bacterium]